MRGTEEVATGGWFADCDTTNNVAEYYGLLYGLMRVLELGIRRLRIYGDSELVVHTVSWTKIARKEDLARLCDRARQLMVHLDSCSCSHIPRESNQQADAQANLALVQRVRLHDDEFKRFLDSGLLEARWVRK